MRQRFVVAWIIGSLLFSIISQFARTEDVTLGMSILGSMIVSGALILPVSALVWMADVIIRTKDGWKDQIRSEAQQENTNAY